MYTIIAHVIYYVVVPAIMLITFAAGVYIALKSGEAKVSAWAGLCAGLVAFALYVVSSSFSLQTPVVWPLALPGFHWVPIIAGVVIGFGLLLLVEQFDRIANGLIGLFVLFLIASSSIAAFSYFFASPLRAFAINFSLATLLGMLVNVVLIPETKDRILDRDDRRQARPNYSVPAR